MIKFTEKIKQDFLPIEWIKRLQDSGIELIDSKYFIIHKDGEEYIETKENLPSIDESISITPTYTLSEILYKLPEYVDDNFGKMHLFMVGVLRKIEILRISIMNILYTRLHLF